MYLDNKFYNEPTSLCSFHCHTKQFQQLLLSFITVFNSYLNLILRGIHLTVCGHIQTVVFIYVPTAVFCDLIQKTLPYTYVCIIVD